MQIIRQIPRKLRDYWLKDVSFLSLFVLLILTLFAVSPISAQIENGVNLINFFVLIILFSGIWSVTKSLYQVIGAALFLLVTVLKVLRIVLEFEQLYLLELLTIALFLLYLMRANFLLLFRDFEVNFYRIIGAVNVYLLIGLLGGFGFLILEALAPGNFNNSAEIDIYEKGLTNFIYFSLVSLSTVGYGDIYPVTPFAKSLSVFISIIGLLYPTLVIARLISIELNKQSSKSKEEDGKPS